MPSARIPSLVSGRLGGRPPAASHARRRCGWPTLRSAGAPNCKLQINVVVRRAPQGLSAGSMTPSRLVALLLGLLLALLALQAAEAADEAQTQATPQPPQPARQRRPLNGARRRVKPVSTTHFFLHD